MSGNDALRPLARDKIASERDAFTGAGCRSDVQSQRRAGMPVPDFRRVDPVPVGAFAAREQKEDRRRGGTIARHRRVVAERLAEMTALRMRPEIEQPDHVGGGKRGRQNLFLRSRISANTFQAGLPARPTDCATSGRSARRNGFSAFSAPIVAGMVGLPAALSRATSSARAASGLLFGSMVLAKRILAAVYSWPQ